MKDKCRVAQYTSESLYWMLADRKNTVSQGAEGSGVGVAAVCQTLKKCFLFFLASVFATTRQSGPDAIKIL